jgi:mannan endo-1,4-beta-mannosidase
MMSRIQGAAALPGASALWTTPREVGRFICFFCVTNPSTWRKMRHHNPQVRNVCGNPTLRRLFFGFVALSATLLAHVEAGFYVQNGRLLDANGQDFVMRGVNHAHTWWRSRSPEAIPNIAATGANSVRIVLANGQRWSADSATDVAALIQLCKDHEMIAILEVHDCTGYPESSGAVPLSTAVDYWINIKNALIGQEDYVIINIANEPYGNGVAVSTWVNEHRTAISRLRNAGLRHTLMVDGGNWGQDWENIMRNNASTVFNSDPDKNVVFSVHMYQVYNNYSAVNGYMESFVNNGLPLVVGEFAAGHYGDDVDEGSIMSRAQHFGIGYLGWSWSGNSSDLADLDIVQNWNPGSLSLWGNTLINGSNGIKATSRKASVFGGVGPNPGNLAQGKPVTASSNDGWADSPAAVADGNMGSRWASQWSDPQWVRIDLEGNYNLNRVVLEWESAYGRAYQIQVSNDGSNWTTISTVSNGNGGRDEINLTGTGRYIRMYGTARATQWGYSLWEFEVYGEPAGNPPVNVFIEAENASLSGVSVQNNSAASGGRYVFMQSAGSVAWTVNVPTAGEYTLSFGYNVPFGYKQQNLNVNGSFVKAVDFNIPSGTWQENSTTANLNAGNNTISLSASWGWMYLDYLKVR